MNEKIAPTMKEEKKSWSKRIEADGKSKSINVREIENGYIVRISFDGENKEGEWEFNETEYFSKDNPLEDLSVEEKNLNSMKQVLKENSLFD